MTGYDCTCCGKHHDELSNCFLIPLPLPVLQVPEAERKRRVEASSDMCVLDDEHFFILGNVDVKVRGSSEFIRWTMWASLSRANFARAFELWETPGRENEPPYFGWLCNVLPGYEPTVHLKTHVHTQPVGIRPFIEIEPEHQLGLDQRDGITKARFDELVHAAIATFPPAQADRTAKKPWWRPW
jgi:hypothetical protein